MHDLHSLSEFGTSAKCCRNSGSACIQQPVFCAICTHQNVCSCTTATCTSSMRSERTCASCVVVVSVHGRLLLWTACNPLHSSPHFFGLFSHSDFVERGMMLVWVGLEGFFRSRPRQGAEKTGRCPTLHPQLVILSSHKENLRRAVSCGALAHKLLKYQWTHASKVRQPQYGMKLKQRVIGKLFYHSSIFGAFTWPASWFLQRWTCEI